MNERETHTEYTGHDLYDLDGDKIGTIVDVRYGDLTGGLTWLVVKTGLLGTKKIMVPASEIRSTPEGLIVPYTKDRVKNAPAAHDETIEADEERDLCLYYGLEYSSSPTARVDGCDDDEQRRAA